MLQKITIQVEGFGEVATQPGPLYLDVLNDAGLDLHNDCGGHGKCGKCRIVFHSAAPDPLPGDMRHLNDTERAEGVRLACFHQVRGDCTISIPEPKGAGMELMDDL